MLPSRQLTGDRYFMGVDPGSKITGWGVVAGSPGKWRYIDSGVIVMNDRVDMHMRLGQLIREFRALLDSYSPNAVGLEKVFMAKNARSALVLGQARGALMAGVGLANTPLIELSATSVKKSVTGSGRADKDQITRVVSALLKLDGSRKTVDETDALAIALATIQNFASNQSISNALPSQGAASSKSVLQSKINAAKKSSSKKALERALLERLGRSS